MAPKGTLTIRVVGDASKFEKTMGKLQGGIGKFGKGSAVAAVAVAAGIAAIGSAALKSLGRVETIGAQTDAVIKSTGGAAGVTRKQIDDLAGSIEGMSGVEAEAITEGQNLLLTFKNIQNQAGEGNDIFDQSTRALVDMAVAMGTEPKAAAIQLGKALNDPIKGIAALSRVGVTFTGDQEAMIRSMVAAGDTMGAQKIILGELNSQFGGSAEAMGETMTGRIERLKHQFGTLTEEIAAKLLPVIERLIEWASDFLPVAFKAITDAVDKVKAKWDAVFPTLQTVFETFLRVVTGVIDGVRGLFSRSEDDVSGSTTRVGEILGTLRDTFQSMFEAVKAIVETVIVILTEAWDRFGQGLVDNLGRALGFVLEILGGAVKTLGGIFDLITAILTGKWGKAWDAVKQILAGVWETMKAIVGLQIEAVRVVIETALGAISMIWAGAWNGVKTFVSDTWETIKGIVSAAVGWVMGKVDAVMGPLQRVVDLARSIPGTSGSILNESQRRQIQNSRTPRFASGVTNFEGGLAYVHKGELLANLPAGTDVIPARTSPSVPNVTVNMRGVRASDLLSGRDVLNMLYKVQNIVGPLKLKIAT